MFGWMRMSGMYVFMVLVDPKGHDYPSYSRTTRLVIQSSTSNFADGQTLSLLPRAPPIHFPKLPTVPATTSRYVFCHYFEYPRLKWKSVQTSLLRALASTTPTYVFPAMNTLMYSHPLTSEHLRVVKEVIGYYVVGPIGKALACGDVGEESPSPPKHR